MTAATLPHVGISIWVGYLTASDKTLAIVLQSLRMGFIGLINAGSFVNIVDMAPR